MNGGNRYVDVTGRVVSVGPRNCRVMCPQSGGQVAGLGFLDTLAKGQGFFGRSAPRCGVACRPGLMWRMGPSISVTPAVIRAGATPVVSGLGATTDAPAGADPSARVNDFEKWTGANVQKINGIWNFGARPTTLALGLIGAVTALTIPKKGPNGEDVAVGYFASIPRAAIGAVVGAAAGMFFNWAERVGT